MVIGCSGAGKSTFAHQLANVTGLPLVHLDQLFWQAGWEPVARPEFLQRVEVAVAAPAWIMDGTNSTTFELRVPRADRIFWLRRGRVACVGRVLRRVASSYGRVRPDMAAGCPEKLDLAFLRYVWTFNRVYDPRITAALDRHAAWGRTIVLSSDREAQSALDALHLD
mgnify:CR=1 FL=1